VQTTELYWAHVTRRSELVLAVRCDPIGTSGFRQGAPLSQFHAVSSPHHVDRYHVNHVLNPCRGIDIRAHMTLNAHDLARPAQNEDIARATEYIQVPCGAAKNSAF
jgi:hypothetical protein